MAGCTIPRQTPGALMGIGSTDGLILLPSLAEQNGSLLMRIYMYMHKVDTSCNVTCSYSLQ